MDKLTRDQIFGELKRRKLLGVEPPDIYKFKQECGYVKNSDFFPVLKDIQTTEESVADYVESIFSTVPDKRDLNFCCGECDCPMCKN